MPFLNSFEAWPIERASFGSRVLPNSTRTITRMMISSVGPRFMRRALFDSGLPREVNPFVSADDHQLPIGVCSGGKERVGEQLEVVERGDREGQRAGADDEGLDAERAPFVALSTYLVDGSHQSAGAPFVESLFDDAGGHEVAHPGEAALEVGAVLAGHCVQTKGAPHGGGITPNLVARSFDHVEAIPVRVGCPDPTRVPAVGVLDRELDEPVAFAAHEHRRARLLHRRRPVHRARSAVIAAVERERPSTEQPADDVDGLGQAGEPLTGRRERQPDGLVLGGIPAGAETDVEPAIADAVEGGEGLGEHRRWPQRLARDQRAETGTGDGASQRGQGDEGLVDAVGLGCPAVLGDVEEQVVRQPERVEAERLGPPRVVEQGVPSQRRFTGHGVVVLRKRETDAHFLLSPSQAPAMRLRLAKAAAAATAEPRCGAATLRNLCRCSNACRTCRKGDALTSSTGSPRRVGLPCSTCMPIRTTTGRCSPSPPTRRRRSSAPRSSSRKRSANTSTPPGGKGCTRGSAPSTSSPSSRCRGRPRRGQAQCAPRTTSPAGWRTRWTCRRSCTARPTPRNGPSRGCGATRSCAGRPTTAPPSPTRGWERRRSELVPSWSQSTASWTVTTSTWRAASPTTCARAGAGCGVCALSASSSTHDDVRRSR